MARISALRRARAEVFITSAAVLAVALALVLLASGPIFADAVSTGALRRSLTDAPTVARAVVVDGRVWADEVTSSDDVVTSRVDAALGLVDPVVLRTIETASFALPDQPSAERTDLVRLGWAEQIEDHASLVAGVWPDPSTSGEPIPVAVDALAADVLGLDLGRILAVTSRTLDAAVEVVVVGHYRVDDPFAAYWHGRDRLAEPLSVTSAFRTANLVTTRGAVEGLAVRPDAGWLVLPDFGEIELDDVDVLRAGLLGLEAEINARLFAPEAETPTEVAVVTDLPDLLVDDDRTLTVARAVIFATVLQLSALAAFALTLVAGLGVDARRSESMLLRARGAAPGQMTRQAVADALLVVAPMALVAPLAATWVVGWFDDFGPLASIGLELQPRPVRAAWWTSAVAAVVTTGLLVAPAARAAIAAASEGATARSRVAGPIQRSGIDLAVLGAAGFAYWQLRVLGDEQTADLRGRFGVDPLVVVAPLFGIVAGALLVLRILPLMAGLAERRVARGRGAVGALTVWQLARRPHRYTRTALLVTMAVAVGTFASVYETTWAASQRDQAAHEVATDMRVEPNRRVGDSVGAIHLSSVLAAIDGVEAVMATADIATSLPGDERDARMLAVEVGAAAALSGDAGLDLDDGLARLLERRPEVPGIDLPGRPVELRVPVSIVEVDETGQPIEPDPDEPPDPPLMGSVNLTLQDGDGLFHVVSAGSLSADTPSRSIGLIAAEVGSDAVARAPLRIVDVQLDSVTQGGLSHVVEVTLGPIEVVDIDGAITTVALDGDPYVAETEVLGFLAAPASSLVSTAADGTMTITVTTGSSLLAVRVVHTVARTLLPDSEVVAGLVDRAWAAAAQVEVGDVLGLPSGRLDEARLEVVGMVDVIPGIDPTTTPSALVDLPSLQWHERAPGQSSREVSAYWLGIDSEAELTADAFTRPPVEAVEVVSLEDRRAELTANPPALGSLGALGAGFLASVILAVTALVLTAVVSVRERAAEFALLDALGLRRGRRRAWLFREQLVIVCFGIVAGTGIGLALAHLVLPVTSFAQDGGSTFPLVTVRVPWARVLGLVAAVAVTSLAAVGIALGLRARASIGTALRTGVDA